MRHLLDITDLSEKEIDALISQAADIKRDPGALRGRLLA